MNLCPPELYTAFSGLLLTLSQVCFFQNIRPSIWPSLPMLVHPAPPTGSIRTHSTRRASVGTNIHLRWGGEAFFRGDFFMGKEVGWDGDIYIMTMGPLFDSVQLPKKSGLTMIYGRYKYSSWGLFHGITNVHITGGPHPVTKNRDSGDLSIQEATFDGDLPMDLDFKDSIIKHFRMQWWYGSERITNFFFNGDNQQSDVWLCQQNGLYMPSYGCSNMLMGKPQWFLLCFGDEHSAIPAISLFTTRILMNSHIL